LQRQNVKLQTKKKKKKRRRRRKKETKGNLGLLQCGTREKYTFLHEEER
jgi:hypothetical protein